MNIEELEPGDVLVLSGQKDSLVSQVIMLLTGSSVSHAAISFAEPQEVVEEKPPEIAVHRAADSFEGRTVYVNRLDPRPDDMRPVLDAARVYLNEEEPYAMSNLYLVGLLLLYKRFTPNTLTKRVMIKVLKTMTAGVIRFVNQRKAPGKLPMVCSQFVYQCFEDAGDAYRLEVRNGLLGAHTLSASAAPHGHESTLDRVLRRVEREPSPEVRVRLMSAPARPASTEPAQTEEEVLTELHDALRSPEPSDTDQPEDELVATVGAFARALHAARPTADPVRIQPMRATAGADPHEALRTLAADQACFVTPADLLDRCENLTRVGTIPA